MRKQQIPDDFDELNNGTYRTGYTHQERRTSGLIAFLLALTIFLGGLASALGLLNIRLVKQLMEAPNPSVPVDVLTQPSSSAPQNLDALDLALPELPQQRSLQLQLENLTRHDKTLSTAHILNTNLQSLVQVQCAGITGAGLVLSSEGFILTNAHLLAGGSKFYVITADGTPYRAALVGYDVLTDLAVLYIAGATLQPARFGDSQQLREEAAIASISDFTRLQDLTAGTITQAKRSMSIGSYRLQLVQTTVGSCDGPMFNSEGQVVGLNSSHVCRLFDLYVQSGRGYAVPSTTIKEVVEQILEYGYVIGRPTLGVRTQEISPVFQQYWDLPGGLRLLEVDARARDQGLEPGDILLALGGQRLTSDEDLYKILLNGTIGETLTAVLFRDGATFTRQLTILDMAG